MTPSNIIISTVDYARLEPLVHDAIVRGGTPQYLTRALRAKLGHAQIVDPEQVPDDIVTMNSLVCLRDLDTDETESYSLVYPSFANIEEGQLSVLTPIGAGVLGHRKGADVDLEMPFGRSQIRIEDVQFQPERIGQYDV